MTLQPALQAAKEIQEFQFKLLARLRIFDEVQKPPIKEPLNLVASSSKFGLICVGTSSGFDVIQTQQVVEQCAGVKKPGAELRDFPRRSLSLGAQPSHLDISCDGLQLAVGFTTNGATVIRIYDVTSLTALNERVVNEVRLLSPLQAVSWNPGMPNLLATCMQDGSAAVYEFKGNSFEIYSIPVEAQATCLCWSPKGKQIVIGSRNGTLNQFKPELKIVKSIPAPQGVGSLVSVQWLSTVQYAVVYSTEGGACLVIVNTPKNQPITYQNYEDVTFSSGDNRLQQFYFVHQLAWEVLMVASANSMEVGVLGLQTEWELWQLEDTARAELPLSSSRQETYPVGMALDTSPQCRQLQGENQSLGPMPLLALLSHEGLLILYWAVNKLQGAKSVCEPPSPLPDTSGLHLFTSPQAPIVQEQVAEIAKQDGDGSTSVSPGQGLAPTSPFTSPSFSQQASLKDPRLESKSVAGGIAGSWMAPTSSNAGFLSSLTQSAFSSTAPGTSPPSFGLAPSTTSLTFNLPPPTASITPTFNIPANANHPPTTAFGISSPPLFGSNTTPNRTTVAPTSLNTSTALPTFNLTSSFGAVSAGVTTSSSPLTFSQGSDTRAPSLSAPAFAVTPTDSTVTPAKPLSFTPLQTSEEFTKSGSLPPSSLIMSTSSTLTSSNPMTTQVKLDLPEAPSPEPSLISSPSPTDSDGTEESQQLRAISEALVLEEASRLDAYLMQKRQNVRGISGSINRLQNEMVPLCKQVKALEETMEELQESKRIQENEVTNIQSFISESFSYIEGMNNRLRLQKNPDYITLQSPQGLDPIQNRKLVNIKNNIHKIDMQLSHINNQVLDKWIEFQDFTKGNNRKCKPIQIPSLESLYQTMMVQNSLIEKQKTRVDKIEAMMTKCNVGKMSSLGSVRLLVNETQASVRDAELSKIAEDFISLNLKKNEKNVDNLHQSMSSLDISNRVKLASRLFDQSGIIKNMIEDDHSNPVNNSMENESSFFETLRSTAALPNVSHSPSMLSTNTTQLSGVSGLQEQKEEDNSNDQSHFVRSTEDFALKPNLGTFAIGSKTNQTVKHVVQNQISTVSSSVNKISNQPPALSVTPPKSGASESSFNTPKAGLFTFNSTLTANPPVSSEPVSFGATKSSPSKGFSFSSLVTAQPFSAGILTTSSPGASSPAFPSLTAPFSFSTSESFKSTEQPKVTAVSTIGTTLQIASSKSDLPETTISAFSSPLSSLGALVSGIEPLKSDSETVKPNKGLSFTNQGNTANISPNQSSVFKLSGSSENKLQTNVPTSNQNTIFGLVQNKQDSGNLPLTSTHSGSAFKNFAFDTSSQKTIIPPSTPPKRDEIKTNETSKESLHPSPKTDEIKTNEPFKSTLSSSSLSFGTPSNVFSISSSSQPQKSFFGSSNFAGPSVFSTEKTPETVIKPVVSLSSNNSPIIEISLNPTQTDNDVKLPKGITLTKIDNSEKKDLGIQHKPSGDSNAESHASISFGLETFKTPTKSPQTAFGGSLPSKAPVMYEVAKAEDESEPEAKADEKQETPLKQETGKEPTCTTSTPAFSFSIASLSKPEKNESQQIKPLIFDLKPPVTTSAPNTSAATATETSSAVSSSQTSTQSTSSTFSFSIPATNVPTTTTTSSFGIGSLSFSDSNSKTGFSFAQTSETSSSTKSIFGGFSSTPTSESTNLFGQSSAASGENKSLFGQQSTETKSIFGTPATSTDKQPAFSFSLSTTTTTAALASTDKQPAFSFSLAATTTTAAPSFFNTPATTASSFFGQPICSPVSTTSSPFGQSSASVFGSPAAQPFGGTSAFGSKPTFGQSGGSFFNQTSGFGASGGSLFGGNASSPAGSSSLFGGSNSQPASPFGQSTGSVFGGSGSFSNTGQSVGQTGFGTSSFQAQTGFGTSSSPPAFGALPSFGGAPTFGGTAFGSPGKVFGGTPASPPTAFGGSPQQQSSTFENLATQNTMTFGNLAQNQAPAFGSAMFQQPSVPSPPPAFSSPNTGSSFGGSSFSSWR